MPARKSRFLFVALLLSVFTGSMFTSCGGDRVSGGDAAWDQVPAILERIRPPSFPANDFAVGDYGAVADGMTDCRLAITAAIEACAAAGGGRVVLPAGEYLVNGPLHLKSNVNLHLAKGATVRFGVNPVDYLPPVLVRWEGTRCYNYSPLIYAYQQENVAITGWGTIDGQCEQFWYLWKLIQEPDKARLRKMGRELVPVEERVFGEGHFLRPTLIEFFECENILIEGVTVKSSPFWTIHPVLCTNVTVRKVTVQRGKSNDDGCNPESSQYVLIEDCTFYTQDDNIAIKAGRDNDAWVENGGRPTENVIIRNCDFRGETGALTIGSEMSGGVRKIFAENCTMDTTRRPFYIKSNTDRGGIVEDLHYRNIAINHATDAVMLVQLDYKGGTGGPYPATFRNFHFENIACNSASTGFRITGLPDKTVDSIFINGLTINNVEQEAEIVYVHNLMLDEVQLGRLGASAEELEVEAGEEQPGRLRWKDLPEPVRQAFLEAFNRVVDGSTGVPAVAREEVKRAFAEHPTITIIESLRAAGRSTYRLTQIFGSDNIVVLIAEDGRVLESL
ncbi:MAG: glycoside hydrolase family 28 protein [Fidelibacterota bacterium]|nr:MAG: glycoside hydrolase family 28 protein [Candidatus Neomarinimicrobiota bacterium]